MRSAVGCAWLLLLASPLSAADWPNWRGPSGNGVAEEGEFPTQWNDQSGIVWKVSLPGRGASTPIVWKQRIFLTFGDQGKNTLACLRWDGKQEWRVAIGEERAGKHKKGSGSNPSAVTDGQDVFVYFKSGDLAAVDFAGQVRWHVNLQKLYGEDTLWWDLGTSPVLTKDHVIVAVMQTGPSYLVAFDKKSGKEAWRTQREVPAPEEAAQSYSTPIVVDQPDGKQVLYVLGADHVTAHEVPGGREIWRVGGLNPEQNGYFRSIASPVLSGDILVAPYARGKSVTAVKLGGKGDVTKTHIAWFKDDTGSDVPTPVAKDGRVYVCSDRGEVSCIDVASGKTIWRETVEKHRTAFSASPILAGGKLYLTREDGKTFILQHGDRYELVAANELPGETVVATPVFVDGRILLRTFDHLYCIGQ